MSDKLETLQKEIRDRLPAEAWEVTQGFFLDFSNLNFTSGHVGVRPKMEKGLNIIQRRERYTPAVCAVAKELTQAGYKVKRDSLTVYVFPR